MVPLAAELADRLAAEMLHRHRAEHTKKYETTEASRRALVDLCRAVLNLNEFVYID